MIRKGNIVTRLRIMDQRSIPASGEPLFIEEVIQKLSSENLEGKSVRITGKLDEHDAEACMGRLVDPQSGKNLVVNTMLIEPFSAKKGSLLQIIGELDCLNSRNEVVLKARVVRCVDGLDMTMYRKALQAQRDYFNSRKEVI